MNITTYINKSGKITIYGESQHLKICSTAFYELLQDYQERTQQLGDKILSTAKNRFKTEKNEFARRKNFISTIKTNTILLN
jgi:hypothetical protein